MTWRVDLPPCVPEWDDEEHKHSRRCVMRVMQELPPPPWGWHWSMTHVANHWGVFLRETHTGRRWWPVGIPVASSAGDLVSVVWAYAQGHRHQ